MEAATICLNSRYPVMWILSAGGVRLRQLGTPPDGVRYATILTDVKGEPLNCEDTRIVSLSANLVEENGCYAFNRSFMERSSIH